MVSLLTFSACTSAIYDLHTVYSFFDYGLTVPCTIISKP